MDLSHLKRYSIFSRKSLVQKQSLRKPPKVNSSFLSFWNALPDSLKSKDLKELVERIQQAKANQKPVLLMMGAHPIKVGLNYWLIEAFRKEIFTALAVNGACLVHDFELALCGNTSEDVAEALDDGSFGMTIETGQTLNQWICEAANENSPLGSFVGEKIFHSGYEYVDLSLFAALAEKKHVPATVHVGMGTDVFQHHPEADGAAIGKASLRDFHFLTETVSNLGDGGVVINLGSAVLLPEVFLKALTVARNLHGSIKNFYTANFDMIQHYRPNENVVRRPTIAGGKGFSFTGHHEILFPLLIMALLEGQS
jgi:hypothetical protein